MRTKSDRGDGRPKRGGSDTARVNELTGIVIHVTRQHRLRIGIAASAAGLTAKEFVRRAAVEAAEETIRKIPPAKT
jgi:hypothetical protein